MSAQGFAARAIIDLLGVSESGYYAWRERTPSARSLRHAWLMRIILDIYRSSGQTFGYRRIRQELGRRYGINVSHGTVELLMGQAGIRGRSGRLSDAARPAAAALSRRRWVIDAVACATPAGTWCAAVVLDVATRRLVSFSTGPRPSALLIDRALDAAIAQEAAAVPLLGPGQTQLAGCSFTGRAHALRHAPASGTVGDRYDHAVAEAFWERTHRHLAGRSRAPQAQDPEEELAALFAYFTHPGPPRPTDQPHAACPATGEPPYVSRPT
jgi:putative transposase